MRHYWVFPLSTERATLQHGQPVKETALVHAKRLSRAVTEARDKV
jgi:hypothetical protein